MHSECEANLVTVLASDQRRWLCHGSGSLSLASNYDLPGFSPRLLCMGFMVNKVTWEHVLLPALLFPHVVVIPPLVSDLSNHPLLTLYALNLSD
jgi:hypothetical protein